MAGRVAKGIQAGVFSIVVAAGGYVTYRMVKNQVSNDIYRERLQQVTRDYHKLRSTYNQAVQQTAVTEVVVNEGRIKVVVRTAEGVTEEFDTPFEIHEKIYFEYLIKDGRVWITQAFAIRGEQAVHRQIRPGLLHVDWDDPQIKYAQAIARGGWSEGRWVITVAGNGALSLRKLESDEIIQLSPPPPVKEFEEMRQEIDNQVAEIGIIDVFKRWMSEER